MIYIQCMCLKKRSASSYYSVKCHWCIRKNNGGRVNHFEKTRLILYLENFIRKFQNWIMNVKSLLHKSPVTDYICRSCVSFSSTLQYVFLFFLIPLWFFGLSTLGVARYFLHSDPLFCVFPLQVAPDIWFRRMSFYSVDFILLTLLWTSVFNLVCTLSGRCIVFLLHCLYHHLVLVS